ncbi:hypothetical protein D3C72_2351820 [compost metagenome]
MLNPLTLKLRPDKRRIVVPLGGLVNTKFVVIPNAVLPFELIATPPIPDRLMTGFLTSRLNVTTTSPK